VAGLWTAPDGHTEADRDQDFDEARHLIDTNIFWRALPATSVCCSPRTTNTGDGYRPSTLNAYNFGLGFGPPSAALV